MRPANDPSIDYKALVRRGYDRCAVAYADSRMAEAHPELDLLVERLEDGASVLDIGCGAGVPVTRALAGRLAVTGVDISSEMIRQAQANVPEASFVHGDVASLEFADASFEAAVAFYSIFHLPREEHADLLRRIRDWLKPGGYLMCTLTRYSEPAYTEEFYGQTMFWSNYSLQEYADILAGLGFTMLETSTVGHGYSENEDAPHEIHPLVFARRQ